MTKIKQEDTHSKYCSQQLLHTTVRLGEVVNRVMEHQIQPQQEKLRCVSQILKEVLPPELWQHCQIMDISGGQLKVRADSPSYMYELQLCSSEILVELHQRCPQIRIKQIKPTVG